MMVSTLYSSSDSIRSEDSVEKLGPCVLVCLNRDSREVWKILWIFHVEGSLRRYMIRNKT